MIDFKRPDFDTMYIKVLTLQDLNKRFKVDIHSDVKKMTCTAFYVSLIYNKDLTTIVNNQS